MIDEVDTLNPALLDLLVTQFRDLYLARETHWLHGLALVEVRSVLGVESQRGSPFNVVVPTRNARSLPGPNLTQAEVEDLYQQYQQESGQFVEPAVVNKVYEVTRGQPSLVSWFGELLTKKFNPEVKSFVDSYQQFSTFSKSEGLQCHFLT